MFTISNGPVGETGLHSQDGRLLESIPDLFRVREVVGRVVGVVGVKHHGVEHVKFRAEFPGQGEGGVERSLGTGRKVRGEEDAIDCQHGSPGIRPVRDPGFSRVPDRPSGQSLNVTSRPMRSPPRSTVTIIVVPGSVSESTLM